LPLNALDRYGKLHFFNAGHLGVAKKVDGMDDVSMYANVLKSLNDVAFMNEHPFIAPASQRTQAERFRK
jgi:hypothetical protein